ncbi:LysR family transcriptional regulator [Thermoactinomyces sp. DSM 45892]|uniref:LysR family transcriptional regulator n=1 Tax=Thermoactinomyces sp. DSM 45892 TaxID=1882753 RepID=UPI00089C083E|nr:LysR family transcriptional regulator [Thermoactinomyces sp. DSM 45892]SDY02846.1 DNA-binding transcriptional regulator, LysR family [Thermoactinomyces sp. DSM 45892]
MELRNLITFRTVVSCNGFTKAAEVLGYAQSSITAQIQALEEELESPLFDRIGKRIILTEIGQRLLPYANQMIQLHDEAKLAIHPDSIPSGVLTIGSPESLAAYRLPALIHEYKQKFPQVKIILKPGVCWQMRQMVAKAELDIAFLLEPNCGGQEDIEIETIVSEPIGLVTSSDHPLAQTQAFELHDLQRETLLLTETGCSYRNYLEHAMQKQGIKPESDMEFWSIEAIKSCVYAGLGIAYLPFISVQTEVREGKLAWLQPDVVQDQVYTQVAYSKKRWMTSAVREWLVLVKKYQAIWENHSPLPS